MWLGPPSMRRKMQLFARARKWPGRGASGSAAAAPPSARAASAASSQLRATEPSPAPSWKMTSRRLVSWGAGSALMRSLEVDELIGIDEDEAEVGERGELGLEEARLAL